VRDVFDLSASDNLIIPSLPMRFTELIENENEATSMLPLRSSEARDECDLSASANLIAPSLPILLTLLSEYKMKKITFVTVEFE
jgi:hypothetical protein